MYTTYYFSNKASGVQSITIPDGDLQEAGAQLGAAQMRVEESLIPARFKRGR